MHFLLESARSFLRRLSIKGKLMGIILCCLAAGSALLGVGMLLNEEVFSERALVKNVSVLASVIGENSRAALAFRDQGAASETLSALRASTGVEAACLFDARGEVFASYVQPGHAPDFPPQPAIADTHRFTGKRLILNRRIHHNGSVLGTLYIRSGTGELSSRVQGLALFTVALFAAIFAVLAVLAAKLIKIITDPVAHLAATAREVSANRNYAIRALKTSDDELGDLVETFNTMLGEIQTAERALRESEVRYRRIFESIPISIWEEDHREVRDLLASKRQNPDTSVESLCRENPEILREAVRRINVLDVNAHTLKMFGAADKSELQEGLHRLILPETLDVLPREFDALMRGERFFTAETALQTMQGDRLDVVFTVTFPQEADAGESVLVNFIDVTDRKRAESALRESETRFRLALQQMGVPAVLHADDGTILLVNERWKEISGYSEEDLPDLQAWTSLAYGAKSDEVFSYVESLYGITSRVDSGEREFMTRDGEIRTWHFHTAPLGRTTDGRRLLVSIGIDVTERRRTQLELAKHTEELARSNEELEQFAYIASHDLKEPLRGISNYAEFLLEDYSDRLDEDGKAKLNTLSTLSKRMESLIGSLLHYSRVGRTELSVEETDLNAVVEDVIGALEISIKEAGVEIQTKHGLPVVRCDRVRVREIFHNLITNAIKYNDKDRKVVEIDWCPEGSPGIASVPVFVIRDNGIGIRSNHQEKIFHIFRRLHGRDKFGGGTGVGLTITQRIVQRHGGKIWVESQVGEGTAVFFTLEEEDS